MSEQVPKQEWAAIVYGRSYHLDFRFIAVPQDFTSQEINWASPYILATTRRARKLPSHPRWSLFKNDSHCIVGVTCMVRDLIGKLGENLIEVMSKDNRGRPLYVFVGYATKLSKVKCLFNLPTYTGECLESFKPPYQHLEKVWLVKDYNKDSKKPLLTEYQQLTFAAEETKSDLSIDLISQLISQLNYQQRSPEQVFLWPNSPEQNRQLWTASAQCVESTSICLDTNGKRYFNSPFLNQTLANLEEFTIQDRAINPQSEPQNVDIRRAISLAETISTKARADIDFTLQQAAKAANASQGLIHNLTDWSSRPEITIKSKETKLTESENFGFKTKSSPESSTESPDWF
jgi:hypothetical protein